MLKMIKSLVFILLAAALPAKAEENNIGDTFAVVWEYTTDDLELIRHNLSAQSAELLALWEKGIVENAYLAEEKDFEKGTDVLNIVFFIKAKSKLDAEKILNEFTFVKKGIAKYEMHPVGLLWLKTFEGASKN
ncbi:hypothetical protein [Enterovibrio norvegicus]|uniref:DUF3574 domain-containing protein n=1 Tax=Enterovibrio norvegicus TaxID=188144 RepID=A0ABV4L8J1_9GAMM|nr:hypothetical protein [Enterovibrio norvegicus]OEF54487.1 hypothetical protein A1OU_05545 [Enterovibrio norvegicus]